MLSTKAVLALAAVGREAATQSPAFAQRSAAALTWKMSLAQPAQETKVLKEGKGLNPEP